MVLEQCLSILNWDNFISPNPTLGYLAMSVRHFWLSQLEWKWVEA